MSGGYWNSQDILFDAVTPKQLEVILEALKRAFQLVDWVESGDSSYNKENSDHLYLVIRNLGDDIFG